MHSLKRLLSAILAFFVLMAVIPSALAAEEKTEYVYELASSVENGGIYAIVVNNNGNYYAVSNADREIDKGLIIQPVLISGNRLTEPSDPDIPMDSLLWSFTSASAGGYTLRSIADSEYVVVSNSFLTTSAEADGFCWEYRIDDDSGNHVVYNYNTNQYMTVRGAGIGFMDVSYFPNASQEYLLFKRVATGNIPVSGVTLNQSSLNLFVGETKSLSAQVLPVDASDRNVTWSSSNDGIASVVNGAVTAVSEGVAAITVTTNDGGYTASCEVNVSALDIEGTVVGYKLYEPEAAVSGFITFDLANPGEYTTISIDERQRFLAGEFYNGVLYMVTVNAEIACVNPADWSSITISKPLNYNVCDMAYDYSTDTMFAFGGTSQGEYLLSIDLMSGTAVRVADISGINGTIAMACSGDGQLYLLNTDGDLYSLDKQTGIASRIGNTGRADVYTYYQCAFFDHNTETLYWVQEGVNEGGMLNRIDTETGEASYIGKIGGGAEMIGCFTYYYPNGAPSTIPVEGVCVNPTSLKLETGETKPVSASVLPVNASEPGISWSSSNPSVAAIDNGVVTALSSGEAIITVTSVDGGYTAQCAVTVTDPMPPATIYGYRYYLNSSMSDGTVDLSWVSFSSDNPSSMQVGITTNYDVEAAEYYDGNVYGYDNDGDFFYIALDEGWRYYYPEDRVSILGMLDMAYDYSQNRMFGVREDNRLYYVSDMSTGEQTLIGQLNMRVYALCCSTEGRLYGIAANGYLYEIDKQTAQMSVVGSTGVDSVYFRQSMAYDHNTGKAYWCAFNTNIEGHLREVDLENGTSRDLGVMQYNADITGMFIPYDPANPPSPSPSPTPTPTPSPTPTPTPSETPTPTPSETPTPTPSETPTPTPSETPTPTPSESPTPTPSESPTPSPEPSNAPKLYAYSVETLPECEQTYSWLSFSVDNPSEITYEYAPPFIFEAATYYNGKLYAYDEFGFMFEYDLTDWSYEIIGFCTPYVVYDMSVDPSNGTVYALVYSDGLAQDTSQFAQEGYYIATVNMSSCTLTELYMVGSAFMPIGLAAIGDGRMLSVDSNTNQIVIFDTAGNYTFHGGTGYAAEASLQGMAYCRENGLVYWGAVDTSGNGALITIDPQDCTVDVVGPVGERLSCMFFISNDEPVLLGDANSDGSITQDDALLILRHALGISLLPDEVLAICDVNSDGVVSHDDALLTLRIALGLKQSIYG